MRSDETQRRSSVSTERQWRRRYWKECWYPLVERGLRLLLLWILMSGTFIPSTSAEESSSAPSAHREGGALSPTAVQVLSLDEAYHLALANEEQIKIAGHELAKAQLLPWRALTLLAPRSDINGAYVHNKDEIAFTRAGIGPDGTFAGTVSTIRPLETWQGVFSITQPIIQPSFLPTWRLGQHAVRENAQRYGFTIREVLFGVAKAYYDVLRSQQQVIVAQDALRLAEDELRQAQARFRVGAVTKTDVLRADVAVARAQRALLTNQNRLQLALTILARVVGVRTAVGVVEPSPLQYFGGSYEQLLDRAYKQRQDLRAVEAAVEVARQRRHQIVTRYFPQLSTQWQYPRLDPETFSNRDEFWTLIVNFQVPLFDGGVRELDLQEQNENLAEAQLQYERLRKEILVEVKQALLEVETLGAVLDTLKKELTLAQENYNITSKQYRVGLATSLDVNTALNNLNQVRTQLADQTYSYQVALLGLDRAVGVFAQDYVPQR
jgi:outer membrane protein